MTRARLLVAALALGGCRAAISDANYDRSALAPAGPAARILAQLGLPVLVGFVVASLVLCGLVVWLGWRRTGRFDEHAAVSAGGGFGWMLVGGFVIPGVVFVALFVATLGVLDAFPMADHVKPGRAAIRVVGHQWWWEVQYLEGDLQAHFTTANEIHIPTGRAIELELVSADVIHSFWVPRLHGKVDLVPGIANHIRIEADHAGRFEGACAEFCGLQHATMRFVVVADAPPDYARWLAHQRQPAEEPTDAAALRGRDVFQSGACPMCHAIGGTTARATVGPDLTHIGSRLRIGAGWLTNDVASLHAWIVDAPALRPGVQMPPLTMFTGVQLHDLVTYLEGLK
ncbi:MAG TPA: cytochrome c oxidase subunit II [Polyangia bacterium]|nr:cytochrome c oxidase subunit II [Polyangia bacterium]HWE27438.1 cytochrome c oxidase subunit II [Polyangia bacterium]